MCGRSIYHIPPPTVLRPWALGVQETRSQLLITYDRHNDTDRHTSSFNIEIAIISTLKNESVGPLRCERQTIGITDTYMSRCKITISEGLDRNVK